MNTEEKIYALMVQAEDMQAHAEKLQNGAEETFSGLPLAVEQAGQKIRSTTLLGAIFVLAVGIVVSSVAVAGIWWGTSNLREEAAGLRAEVTGLRSEVKTLEAQANAFSEKASKAILSTCGEKGKGKGRLCIRVNERAGRYGNSQGELFMVIYGY